MAPMLELVAICPDDEQAVTMLVDLATMSCPGRQSPATYAAALRRGHGGLLRAISLERQRSDGNKKGWFCARNGTMTACNMFVQNSIPFEVVKAKLGSLVAALAAVLNDAEAEAKARPPWDDEARVGPSSNQMSCKQPTARANFFVGVRCPRFTQNHFRPSFLPSLLSLTHSLTRCADVLLY